MLPGGAPALPWLLNDCGCRGVIGVAGVGVAGSASDATGVAPVPARVFFLFGFCITGQPEFKRGKTLRWLTFRVSLVSFLLFGLPFGTCDGVGGAAGCCVGDEG